MERPTIVTDEQLEWLAELRESGRTNMLAAPSLLANRFGLNRKEAMEVFLYWVKTFEKKERERND